MAPRRYSYNVDVTNLNTSHSLAVLSVPLGSRGHWGFPLAYWRSS